MVFLRSVVALASAWLLVIAPAIASGVRETPMFAPVVEQTRAYAQQYGADKVLVVCDVDNTLLAMDHDLGSDQWYEWQEYLLAHEPQSPHLVAKDKPGLLAIQGLLFSTSHMHCPETDQPKQMEEIQALGVDTVILTSRGEEFRSATLRELARNGYAFQKTAPAIDLFSAAEDDTPYESSSRFWPYRVPGSEAFGLTDADRAHFGLPDEPREVSYGDGIMMVAGQHKGAMLLVLLALIDKPYDAVVYVDDHGRHVMRVYDAMVRRGIEVTSIHYQHEDPRVRRFNYGDKQGVTRRWRQIDETIEFFRSTPDDEEVQTPQKAAAATR